MPLKRKLTTINLPHRAPCGQPFIWVALEYRKERVGLLKYSTAMGKKICYRDHGKRKNIALRMIKYLFFHKLLLFSIRVKFVDGCS